MRYDEDVFQFMTQVQQQHGSLEPLLQQRNQQRLQMQETHKEQQQALINLKAMYDDLSRRMEETSARAADLQAQLIVALGKKQKLEEQQQGAEQQVQEQKQLLQRLQQQNEAAAEEIRQQAERWQQQLSASEQELKQQQQRARQQQELLQQLHKELSAAQEREAAATAAAETAQRGAEERVRLQLLQHFILLTP